MLATCDMDQKEEVLFVLIIQGLVAFIFSKKKKKNPHHANTLNMYVLLLKKQGMDVLCKVSYEPLTNEDLDTSIFHLLTLICLLFHLLQSVAVQNSSVNNVAM